jgi:DNA-directed RNA polymerase specialized sigma24 family protein
MIYAPKFSMSNPVPPEAVADPRGLTPILSTDRAAATERRRSLARGLSASERLVVTLFYYEKMTIHEIGQTLGVSETHVKELLNGVVQRFRGGPGSAAI